MLLVTKRVLLSLGVGIITSALFLTKFNIVEAGKYIYESFKVSFVEDGSLNTWSIFILLFILSLGVLTSFITLLGGTRAFGDCMIKRIKTREGAKFMPMVLGIIIFIDDYFISLTVVQISLHVTN